MLKKIPHCFGNRLIEHLGWILLPEEFGACTHSAEYAHAIEYPVTRSDDETPADVFEKSANASYK